MNGVRYEDLAERLTPEARKLSCEMAEAHVEAGSVDRLFIRTDTMAATGMIFAASKTSRQWDGFDAGARLHRSR